MSEGPAAKQVKPIAMFTTSSTTAQLDAALAKAQGEIEGAIKDKMNPHFRSMYADLASIWAACRPALAKHGISVTQWPIHSDDGKLHLITRVSHCGEWLQSSFSIPVTKQDAHGFGSAITYTKRFALAAALGIASEDDDGNEASNPLGGESPTTRLTAERSTTGLNPPPPATFAAPPKWPHRLEA